MIQLSNGHIINYVASSGSLAYDGKGWAWERPLVRAGLIKPELFTVVIKTLTRHPREGNLKMWWPWSCIRLIPGGSVNKVGLTNPGILWWRKKIAPTIDFEKYSIVVSIYGDENELVEMTQMMNRYKLVALEVNPSCPNTGHMDETETIIKSVKAVKKISRHPIIVKIAVNQEYLNIAEGLTGIAEAISINSVPWKIAFPNGELSPLWRLEQKVGGGGGGVSGKPAQKENWKAVKALSEQGLVPVIGSSVMDYDDMKKVRKCGAQAISFGAIHFLKPCAPTLFVKTEKEKL